jgi:pimeloyl-ACP methyl ester carboxylesterase
VQVSERRIGGYTCLVVGAGPPLVLLPGLAPEAGVAPGAMRRVHESTARGWAGGREVFYINRRPGMPRGITMSQIADEHAAAMRSAFDGPVDVLGVSTGGSIAQQLAAEHPDVVRRLALVSTGWKLGPLARSSQRKVAARVRAGAYRKAFAVLGADIAWPEPLKLFAAAGAYAVGPHLVSADGLRDMATMIEAEDGFDLADIPEITAPTLLVGGGRDRFYSHESYEQTARLIPGCHLSMHQHRGHVTVMWDARAVAQLRGFLGSLGT